MNELMNLRDKRVQTWNAAKAYLESHKNYEIKVFFKVSAEQFLGRVTRIA